MDQSFIIFHTYVSKIRNTKEAVETNLELRGMVSRILFFRYFIFVTASFMSKTSTHHLQVAIEQSLSFFGVRAQLRRVYLLIS